MIGKEALVRIARLNNLRPWQQEKHYIQSAVLAVLSETPVVMKGGTYLWLFHGLDRFSEDLDFTALEGLQDGLPKWVSESLSLFGIENHAKIISDNRITCFFRIGAKGPLFTSERDLCYVYVEISKREKVLAGTLALRLENAGYALPSKIIKGMNIAEVAAEKIRAVMTRNLARDVYDLNFLITKKCSLFDRPLVNEKLTFYNKEFSKSDFMKNIRLKEKLWIHELKPLVFGELSDFKAAEKNIGNWIAD